MLHPKRRLALALLALFAPLAAFGCDAGPKGGYGFRLPDGDVEDGRRMFALFYCHDCHDVAGDPEMRERFGEPPYLMTVELGGGTTRVHTYGELVTSIINPSHRISDRYELEPVDRGRSPMRNYNDIMTITELSDIVAYVQSHYELVPPDTEYGEYNYP